MANIVSLVLGFSLFLAGVGADCADGSCAVTAKDDNSSDDSGLMQLSPVRSTKCGDGGTTLPGSSSNWCGPGQDPTKKGCAENWCLGDYPGDWGCRRHDACKLVEYHKGSTTGKKFPILACSCDKDLYDTRDEDWHMGTNIACAYVDEPGTCWRTSAMPCIAKKGTKTCKKWGKPQTDTGTTSEYKEVQGNVTDYETEECDIWNLEGKYDLPFEDYGYYSTPDGHDLNSQKDWPDCKPNPAWR